MKLKMREIEDEENGSLLLHTQYILSFKNGRSAGNDNSSRQEDRWAGGQGDVGQAAV